MDLHDFLINKIFLSFSLSCFAREKARKILIYHKFVHRFKSFWYFFPQVSYFQQKKNIIKYLTATSFDLLLKGVGNVSEKTAPGTSLLTKLLFCLSIGRVKSDCSALKDHSDILVFKLLSRLDVDMFGPYFKMIEKRLFIIESQLRIIRKCIL